MRIGRMQFLLAAALLLLAAGPAAAQFTIFAGDDPLSTTGSGGGTSVDLAGYPIESVFGAPVEGSTVVTFRGESLGPGSTLAGIDTIIRRPTNITLTGGVGSGPLRVVALRLVGQNRVRIGGTDYTVRVCLSNFSSSVPNGSITLRATTSNLDGGSFSSNFLVQPKLIFTDDFGGRVEIDCGAIPCGDGKALVLSAVNVPFTRSGGPGGFQPTAKGIKPLPAGLAVDGTCDNVADLTTRASTNFFVGVSPIASQGFPIRDLVKQEPGGVHRPIVPIPAAASQVAPFPGTSTSGTSQ